MQSFRGLYRHIRTGKTYFAEGTARHVSNPNKLSVVYCQKYEGKLDETDTKLPVGTMWIRDTYDFSTKFERVEQELLPMRIMTSITSTLEKDVLFGYNKK